MWKIITARKNLSAVLSVALFGSVLGVVFVNAGLKYLAEQHRLEVKRIKERQEIIKTEELLADLAKSFAHDKKEVVTSWAKGVFKDSWNNDPILEVNNEEKVKLVSKGKDGLKDTEDDVFVEYARPEPEVKEKESKSEPEPEPEPKVEEIAEKGFLDKAKETFGKVKFEFRWEKK